MYISCQIASIRNGLFPALADARHAMSVSTVQIIVLWLKGGFKFGGS